MYTKQEILDVINNDAPELKFWLTDEAIADLQEIGLEKPTVKGLINLYLYPDKKIRKGVSPFSSDASSVEEVFEDGTSAEEVESAFQAILKPEFRGHELGFWMDADEVAYRNSNLSTSFLTGVGFRNRVEGAWL